MAEHRAYLDYNASAPLLPAARVAVVAALDAANPSSVHAEGRAARRLVEDARRDVAALVNAKPDHVFFTSGATGDDAGQRLAKLLDFIRGRGSTDRNAQRPALFAMAHRLQNVARADLA